MCVDFKDRITLEDVAEHPWLAEDENDAPERNSNFSNALLHESALITECSKLHGLTNDQTEKAIQSREPSPVYATFSLLQQRKLTTEIGKFDSSLVPRLAEVATIPVSHIASEIGDDCEIIVNALERINDCKKDDFKEDTLAELDYIHFRKKGRINSVGILKSFNRI